MRGDSESAELKIHLPIGYPVTDGGIFIKFSQICNGLRMSVEIHIYLPSNISKETMDSLLDYCVQYNKYK